MIKSIIDIYFNLENISADDYENIKKGMKTIENIPPGEALEIFHECLEANFDKEIKKENREFQTIFNYCFQFLKDLTEEKKKEELRISKEQLQVSILQKKMEELKPRETDDANEKKRKIDDFEIIFKENSKQIKFDSWSAPKSFAFFHFFIIFIWFFVFLRKKRKFGSSKRK